MKKSFFRSFLVPALMVFVGGFLIVALSWGIYLGVTILFESLFYPNNPQDFPQDTVRNVCVYAFCLLYIVVLLTKVADLVKATLLVGPMTMFLIAIILRLYQKPMVAVILCIFLVACCIGIIVRTKKSWTYSFATVLSLVLAILYAWPRG